MAKSKKIKLTVIILTILSLFISAYFVAVSLNKPSVYKDNTAEFIHKSPDETVQLLSEKKQGIYYFGFSTCPWCKELLPVLDMRLKETGNKALVTDTKAKDYTSAVDSDLEKFFKTYTNEKSLLVPFVVAINSKGEVETNIGTVKEHDAKNASMTSLQKQELEKILNKMIQFSRR